MSWEFSEGMLAAVNGVMTRNNGQFEAWEVQTGYKKILFPHGNSPAMCREAPQSLSLMVSSTRFSRPELSWIKPWATQSDLKLTLLWPQSWTTDLPRSFPTSIVQWKQQKVYRAILWSFIYTSLRWQNSPANTVCKLTVPLERHHHWGGPSKKLE